jgi:hypothetical protein
MSPESKQFPLKPHVPDELIPEAKLKSREYYEKVARNLDHRFACVDPGRVVYSSGLPPQPPFRRRTICTDLSTKQQK